MNVSARLCALAGVVLSLTTTSAPAGAQVPTPPASASFSEAILNAHNKYRIEVGIPPLVWSNELAGSAQAWANALSSNLSFAHDPGARSANQGENLWMGTTGAFSLAQMVDSWGQERRNFQDGTFPDVSTTGNWFDVGHYSQMVWRNTTSVGCAGAAGSDGNYRLVCRYSPPGNVVGEEVF
jgi:Cysteine-rich secretory protein family